MNFDQTAFEIKEMVSNRLTGQKLSDTEYVSLVKEIVFERLDTEDYSYEQKKNIINWIINTTKGHGVIQPLIDDPDITEIMVVGPDKIFIEKKGELFESGIKFDSAEELERVIRRIAELVNREINLSNPIVDARLLDGSRVNAVIPPIALNGPFLTIRKFPENPFTVQDLINFGSLTVEAADFLEKLVISKYNLFISGGTGSGKTTFLNAMSNFIPSDQRVITIEDSAELQISGISNLLSMETRDSGAADSVNITIRDLIKTSLRMRPDRVVVGEVRGGEALDMLQAMNTGHDGSLSTGHANSSFDMLSRLESMVLMAIEIPIQVIRAQISSAIDIIVHLGRLRDRSRRVLEISEVKGLENGEIKLNVLYKFVELGVNDKGKIIGELRRTESPLIHTDKLQAAGYKLTEGKWCLI